MALMESIRNHLLPYLAGDKHLGRVRRVARREHLGAHLSDPAAADLKYTLKHLVAEYTSGHRSEVDLRPALVPIAKDMGPSPDASSSSVGGHETLDAAKLT